MLVPTRFEKLNQNLMVIGADVIKLLHKQKYSVEELYQILKESKQINLERFYNALAFLWSTGVIESDDFYIFLKK
jgi:hypothetical protein